MMRFQFRQMSAISKPRRRHCRKSTAPLKILTFCTLRNEKSPMPTLGTSSNGFKTVVDIDLLGAFNVLRSAYALLSKPSAAAQCLGAAGILWLPV